MSNKQKLNTKTGDRVRQIREKLDLSQSEFAEKLEMSAVQVSRLENGVSALTQKRAKQMIELSPDYRLEWLLGLDDFKTETEKYDHMISIQRQKFDDIVERRTVEHENTYRFARFLAEKRGIDLRLYYEATGAGELQEQCIYKVSCAKDDVFMSHEELADLIDDYSYLFMKEIKRRMKERNGGLQNGKY